MGRDPEAHRLELRVGETRRVPVLEQVHHLRDARERLAEGGELALALRCLEEEDVRPEIGEGAAALEGFVEAMDGAGIGARHDQQIGAALAGVDGRAEPELRLVPGDDLLAARVATALGRDLVLDHGTGKARARIALERPAYVHRIAVARVGIADDRDPDRLTDPASLVEHLAEGDEPGVGDGESRRRDREAAHERQPEPRALDQARREGVEAAGHDVQAVLGEQRPQARRRRRPRGSGLHRSSFARPRVTGVGIV
jgi:hypothetical protein